MFCDVFSPSYFTTYNENGNKIENNYYNSDGSLGFKNTYKYDENGNNIEECRYEDGKIEYKITYKYDEKGNKIIMTPMVVFSKNPPINTIKIGIK